jgi:hypothetical protein
MQPEALFVRRRRIAAAWTRRVSARDSPLAPSLVTMTTLTGRKPLNDSVPGEHSTIDREVSAHHESSHGSVFLRQLIRFVRQIGTVLSPINLDETSEARFASVDLVQGVTPAATMAESCVWR